jgi:SAM-dependent methyltransferase
MNTRHKELREEWDERARRLGFSKRAVLFKRLPGFVNRSIHHRHIDFIMNQIPIDAIRLLDVGCGYGRISKEIKEMRPNIELNGVELSGEFASVFEKDIGPCFNGPISDFYPESSYDIIIVVTLLMYLEDSEQLDVVKKLWSFLNAGGKLICIEPAAEIHNLWKTITRTESASPTGGTIRTYGRSGLSALFENLPGAQVSDVTTVRLIKWLNITALHHGISVAKESHGIPE